MYLRPVLIELPHIASLHDEHREVIALRSDDGITWHEHPVTASEIVAGLQKFAGELCCGARNISYFQCVQVSARIKFKFDFHALDSV